jgi:hypothetical protein
MARVSRLIVSKSYRYRLGNAVLIFHCDISYDLIYSEHRAHVGLLRTHPSLCH